MQAINEREMTERNRQSGLVRQFFGSKKALLDARQALFLHRYPYLGTESRVDLRRFENVVNSANTLQRVDILNAFESEKRYWNSAYVLDHCNCNIHIHIINTLDAMERVLREAGISETTRGVYVSAYSTADESNNPTKQCFAGNSWGRAGEDAVDYVLKWLPDSYCVIEKDCSGKYSDNVILLKNPTFSDENQEFDHLVIGPQGIFNIETKNYSGKLVIDKAGNWNRIKKGETDWIAEQNPAQQLFRHHILLQSIVGTHVPIHDVICMSHPSLMIIGQENSRIPVIKKDLLADYIVNLNFRALTPDQIKEVEHKINLAKTDK